MDGSDVDANSDDLEHSDIVSQSSADSVTNEPEEDVKEISFGVLAKAQEQFLPNSRKRKLVTREPEAEDGQKEHKKGGFDYDRAVKREPVGSRSSKHAPTIMSTRMPVSRKRDIFSPPPALKFRDPRFDAAVVADGRRGNNTSTQNADKNYAFLSEYQAAEVLELKSQIKKSQDPSRQAQLKREVMSIEAKLRNAENKRREMEILKEHKQKERQAIKEGKKERPYYLKESAIRSQLKDERQNALGKRARDKSEKRKKKREKTKEARDMPRMRRTFVPTE